MIESNDLLQIVVGLLSLGVFFLGFSSVRLQSSYGRIEARLEQLQDRLAEEAKRDDSFPLPWDLDRLRSVAFEERPVDRVLTTTTLVVVSALNALVLVVTSVYGIAPSFRPIPLSVSVGVIFVAVIVQLVAVLEFNLSSRLPHYAINRSPLGAWHSIARTMNAGDFAQARKEAQRLLELMPSWPWGDIVIAIATARLHGPEVIYAGDFDSALRAESTGKSEPSVETGLSDREAMAETPDGSGPFEEFGEAYQPVAQLITRLDVLDRIQAAGWSERDDPRRGPTGYLERAHRTSAEDWILIREILASHDLILSSAGHFFGGYSLEVEAIDEHLKTRILNSRCEDALAHFSWWRSGTPLDELRWERSASAGQVVVTFERPR